MTLEPSSKKNTILSKILILGNGYIGNYLNNYLTTQGHEVKIVDSSDLNYHDRRTLWMELVAHYDPSLVINCSGFTGRPNIDEAETKKDQCWHLNVTSPMQCAELCAKAGKHYIHIGSGCIYTDYDKEYTEEDAPNFGLFSNDSSFYSKTKHAFELMTTHLPIKIIRIRMPISGLNDSRSYLSKIKKYDKLIDYKNSKTYIPDLCIFVNKLISNPNTHWDKQDIYNVVNPEPLDTKALAEIMNSYKEGNPNWEFVPIDEIPIVAGRSNCILNNEKAMKIHPMRSEKLILQEVLNG
jgi:dTDP-4-dehydrorhamnose reductase